MSHFEYSLNQRFGRSKKLYKLSKLGGGGGGNLDKIQKNNSIFSGCLPLGWSYSKFHEAKNNLTQIPLLASTCSSQDCPRFGNPGTLGGHAGLNIMHFCNKLFQSHNENFSIPDHLHSCIRCAETEVSVLHFVLKQVLQEYFTFSCKITVAFFGHDQLQKL